MGGNGREVERAGGVGLGWGEKAENWKEQKNNFFKEKILTQNFSQLVS